MELNSIGELIDKLVIENIKIFSIREKMHKETLTDEQIVKLNEKMIMLNENRGIIAEVLDKKIDRVVNKQEKNNLLKKMKTYSL